MGTTICGFFLDNYMLYYKVGFFTISMIKKATREKYTDLELCVEPGSVQCSSHVVLTIRSPKLTVLSESQ